METVSQQADIGESVLKMVTVITESKADIDSGTKVGIRDIYSVRSVARGGTFGSAV